MSNTPRARQFRKNPTDAERALWSILRKGQIPGHRFRRQAPIGPYIVDFVCFENKLVIEVDGGQHAEQADYDATRTVWLESQGFRVMRFWNNRVLEEMDAVREAVWLEVGGGAPPRKQRGAARASARMACSAPRIRVPLCLSQPRATEAARAGAAC